MTAVATRSLSDRALEVLRRVGNPFRNYFARNPDDEVCARYHVPELFTTEREQLLGVVPTDRSFVEGLAGLTFLAPRSFGVRKTPAESQDFVTKASQNEQPRRCSTTPKSFVPNVLKALSRRNWKS